MRPLGALAVIGLLLAGCLGDEAPAEEPVTAPPEPDLPQVSGSVVDPALKPVPDARVEIASEGVNATTDENGAFAFDGLSVGVPLVVVTTAEGFVSASKSITLVPDTPIDLDFQLERVPVVEPYHKTESYDGFLSCSTTAESPAGSYSVPCDASGSDVRTWDVRVDEAVEGIIVEVAWDAGSQAAQDLNVTVEAVGFGDQNEVLADAEGPSILRAQVSNAATNRYYTDQGGVVRVTVDIGADTEANEAGTGGGVAFQQEFQVFVTAFYHERPPPGWTIA